MELRNSNHISYKQAWRTQKRTEQGIFGEEGESFKKVPFFLDRLSRADDLSTSSIIN
jgi:hypothetical protein